MSGPARPTPAPCTSCGKITQDQCDRIRIRYRVDRCDDGAHPHVNRWETVRRPPRP